MKSPLAASLVFALAMAAAQVPALADEHGDHGDHRDNHAYVHHDEWRKGYKLHDEDWQRGEHIDYRHQHLRRPPHGYEWREVDGNYVLAAVATGVIASVVAASVEAH